MQPSRIERTRLADALETQTLLLREEQAHTREIDDRAEAARLVIDECSREHQASVGRQVILTNGILLYQGLLDITDGTIFPTKDEPVPVQDRAGSKTKPARLGKQHYRMWHAIRENELVSVDDLATLAHVSARSARVQMAEDAQDGLVVERDSVYGLTPEGADLLKRFEDYRRSKGLDLPPLLVSDGEDERDGADPETQAQEEENE